MGEPLVNPPSEQFPLSLDDVECRGPYRFNQAGKLTLSRLSSTSGIIVEHSLKTILEEQGYFFDDELDNKSAYDPVKQFTALGLYGKSMDWSPKEEILTHAFNATMRAFGHCGGSHKLKPWSLSDVISYGIKPDKSSGAPYFGKKSDDPIKELQMAQRVTRNEKAPPPCVAYHRVQHGEEGPKQRLVWGYPFCMTLIEGRFARPLLDYFLRNTTPMAFGLSRQNLAARMVPLRNMPHQVSIDYSKFDSTVNARLIDMAFMILKTHFNLSEEDDSTWRKIGWYFIHTSIIMPDGNVWQKHRGVASGSYFTQLVGTIINMIITYYCFMRAGTIVRTDRSMFLGDDSINGVATLVDLTKVAAYAQEVGMVVNPLKCRVTHRGREPYFLGHTWKRGLVSRPAFEIAQRIVYPERHSPLDPRVRQPMRVIAYMSDAVEAWKIVSDFAKYRGGDVRRMLHSIKRPNIPITKWEEVMSMERRNPNFAGLTYQYFGPLY